ncbi:MAG: type I DNA topoisomerase, partial [Eubacteriales bacterium]|nr:type I DNA topoisomerase [Eubacteriales bacterium]
MSKNLVIVESPGKIKSIAKYLGRSYKVEASGGHVRDLPEKTLGVSIDNDFEPKYVSKSEKKAIITNLKKEAQNSENIYLATDPDREGEAISWHIANILKISESEKCRITFNEITESAVKDAILSPREIDAMLVNAQQARRILDRIIGYKISPLLNKKLGKGQSAGRVQSVTLRLVCDREEEINGFKPQEYWTLDAMLQKITGGEEFTAKFYGSTDARNKKIDLKNKEQVDSILEEIKNLTLTVSKVSKKEKKKGASPPFITSTLQQEASRKLGFTAKRTMSIAQKLYEGVDIEERGTVGLITYMRTDSLRVSEGAREEARSYIKEKYGEAYVPAKPNYYKNRAASQDAHEAIRPSYIDLPPEKIKSELKRENYLLYELIWNRFIASQMSAAVYDTVQADIAAGKYLFKANGSKIKFRGFIAVYVEGRDDQQEEKQMQIPELNEGEDLKLVKFDPRQCFTKPPLRYTEASLVKELEEKGIGRPSTYASTISTILDREYVKKDGKQLFPSEQGVIVTDLMKKYFGNIVDIKFTAEMESKLDEIENGQQKEWKQILRDFYPSLEKDLKRGNEEIIKAPPQETDEKCEKCGKPLVIRKSRNGEFLGCSGFPECRFTKPLKEDIKEPVITGVL